MLKNKCIIFVFMGISGMLFTADSDDMPGQKSRKRGRDLSTVYQVKGVGQKTCNVTHGTEVVSLLQQGELADGDLQDFIQSSLEEAEHLFDGECATFLRPDSSSVQSREEDDQRYLKFLKDVKSNISNQSMRIDYDERAQVVLFVFEIDTNDGMTLTSKTVAFKNAEGAWVMQGG